MKRKKSIGRLRRAIEKLKRAIKEWREAKEPPGLLGCGRPRRRDK